MTFFSGYRLRGFSGTEFDRFVQRHDQTNDDNSKLIKMQQLYWETKQTFIRKLKRKEDDCIIAGDALLDSKLEVNQQ